jgi:spoIIIJ-associated protein
MSNERFQKAQRPGKRTNFVGRERNQPIPPFDRERATVVLKEFLDLAIEGLGLLIEYHVVEDGEADGTGSQNGIVAKFHGPDQDLLLERNAELLLALEHIAHRWLRLDPRLHDSVRLDCGDYRATRLAELKLSARVAAQRVRETGQPHRFNPMSPRERRIVHLELSAAHDVRTMSEGSGDRRQLVIYPANKK